MSGFTSTGGGPSLNFSADNDEDFEGFENWFGLSCVRNIIKIRAEEQK